VVQTYIPGVQFRGGKHCPPEVLQNTLAALLPQCVQDDLRSCSTAAQYCNMQTASSNFLLHKTLLKAGDIPRFWKVVRQRRRLDVI